MNKTYLENKVILTIRPHREFSDSINQYQIAEIINEFRHEEDKISPRAIRKIIEDLIIKKGCPIISTPHRPGGYCWEGADGEALACYQRLRRKAAKEFKRARCTLRNMFKGQLSLFDAKRIIRD